MCTAIGFKTKDKYFGRNLDLEYSYDETVTITPRNYPIEFSNGIAIQSHFSMIGMAYVVNDYPLYYDATNEKGLSMAGLSFSGNAYYGDTKEDMDNISPYEFILWILCQCADISEAMLKLSSVNLINKQFNSSLPLTDLHWIITDKTRSIVVEPLEDGLKIYGNPLEVLTNNPPFNYHLANLNNYLGLSKKQPEVTFAEGINLDLYSRGLGAIGLPGDMTSMSRFVRAAFMKCNSECYADEASSVSQFFHILGTVEQLRGCVKVEDKNEITVYSSCCNTSNCVYYYKTYDNSCINAVSLFNADIDGFHLISYELDRYSFVNYDN